LDLLNFIVKIRNKEAGIFEAKISDEDINEIMVEE
jgi:hypothetical protein